MIHINYQLFALRKNTYIGVIPLKHLNVKMSWICPRKFNVLIQNVLKISRKMSRKL